MANDFGFRDLSWIKFAGQQTLYESLSPLRDKEKTLEKEIRTLLEQVDVKQMEIRHLHLKSVLEAKTLGVTRKDIQEAVKAEFEDRINKRSFLPSSSPSPSSPLEDIPTEDIGDLISKETLAEIFTEALEDLEGAKKIFGGGSTSPTDSKKKEKKKTSLVDYLGEEWASDAKPTPVQGVFRNTIGRLFPGGIKEEKSQRNNDNDKKKDNR